MVNQRIMAAAAGLVTTASSAAPDVLLPLPPMGFNNWARFQANIKQSIFVDAADAMLDKGLLAAGYNRINLDDAWSLVDRASNGSMVWDPVKFPKGLYWMTDYIKSKGFIPGIYTDSGTKSCGGFPGAEGYEEIDYEDFTRWGFEYLKMDGCYVDSSEEAYHKLYSKWHTITSTSENPMIFSDSAPAYFSGADNLTDWYTVMGWCETYGQLARHSDDIATYPDGDGWASILDNYGQHVRLARYQRPGYFNDPDFLIVDHPSLSMDEKMSHFALWASLSAPLILSTDMKAITDEEVKYLTNAGFLAVNQDALVKQATLVSQDGSWDVLTKSLSNGDRLVTVLNRGAAAADQTVSWARLGLSTKALRHTDSLDVTSLWTGETSKVSVASGGITAKSVPSHGTAGFRISLSNVAAGSSDLVTPTGMIFNTFSLNCLTDDKSGKVTWAKCTGADAQVWATRSDGHINSLLRPDECIVDVKGTILSRHSGCHTESWTYMKGGNLINDVSKHCLTEGEDGTATAEDCGYETNEQVVGLPVGGKVVGIEIS